jgi:hypothetical protein
VFCILWLHQILHNMFCFVSCDCIKYYATFFALYPVNVSNITQHFLFCILWVYQILRNILCFVLCDCIKYYPTFFCFYPVNVSNIMQHFLFCILWLYQILRHICICALSCDLNGVLVINVIPLINLIILIKLTWPKRSCKLL